LTRSPPVYLFKLRRTKRARALIAALEASAATGWNNAGQGWEAAGSELALEGWTRRRRVVLLLPSTSNLPPFCQRRTLSTAPFRLYVADTGNAAIRLIDTYAYGDGLTTLVLSAGKEPDGDNLTPCIPDSGGGAAAGTGASDGGSGGGSIGEWPVAALAGAWMLRKLAEGFPRRVRLRGPVGM